KEAILGGGASAGAQGGPGCGSRDGCSGGNPYSGSSGQAGGGFIYLAVGTIVVNGSIQARGGNGGNGSRGGNGTTQGCEGGGAGGGGSGGDGAGGGTIMIAAGAGDIGNGRVNANGGNGGGGGGGGTGGRGSGCGSQSRGGNGGNGASGSGGDSGRVIVFSQNLAGSSSPGFSQLDPGQIGAGAPQNGYGSFYIGRVDTSNADLAENYPTVDASIEAGDVVSFVIDPDGDGALLRKASRFDPRGVAGVISTAPGLTLGANLDPEEKRRQRPLALAGRVPVKVTLDGGAIAPGDRLALSDTPGVARRARDDDKQTLGIALEAFDDRNGADIGVVTALVQNREHLGVRHEELLDRLELLSDRIGTLDRENKMLRRRLYRVEKHLRTKRRTHRRLPAQ
ncbi:MAG: hypothetical protein ACPGQS_07300, partial [Bradymonadia bacterium]